ncbi:unnamed protein product [Ectocarpus sp. 8 AP-2014]
MIRSSVLFFVECCAVDGTCPPSGVVSSWFAAARSCTLKRLDDACLLSLSVAALSICTLGGMIHSFIVLCFSMNTVCGRRNVFCVRYYCLLVLGRVLKRTSSLTNQQVHFFVFFFFVRSLHSRIMTLTSTCRKFWQNR